MRNMAVAICVHDDNLFLAHVVRAFHPESPVFVFVSRLPWSGEPGNWQESVRIAESCEATAIVGNWANETLHRRAALDHIRGLGFSYVFIPDSDEIPEPGLLQKLHAIAEAGIADKVRVQMNTYWKTTSHAVRPPESLAPLLLINLDACTHRYIREFDGGIELLLGREHGVLHHLSYVGPDSRIEKKVSSWSHKDELVPDWWEQKWLAWDNNPCLRDLHPTHPRAFAQVERIGFPEILKDVDPGRQVALVPVAPADWPSVSVVIPLFGGEEDIAACLESLEGFGDLLYETIVVDDLSPDGAADIAEAYRDVKVIRRAENGGFAAACNEGLANASGEVVIFLNSDTVVPRAGLIRLVECLVNHPEAGAVGPVSNNIAYFQKIDAPVSDLQSIDGFANDLAATAIPDMPTSMLVGFCVAVWRDLVDHLGGFSTAFGKGMYEDNDLSYRIQREGRQLLVCRRSFVFHLGSKSLDRLPQNPAVLMRQNEAGFRNLYSGDVQAGYASHLPGERLEPIRFNPERHPDALRARLKARAAEADISLCMIVRDEERVIADCLRSVEGVFNETIVVDTGSTDRTKEIVAEFGAQVYDMVWPESFSVARNESLKHATGTWIFWMDADDVLPPESAERIIDAAINAPGWVTGFVVPVQFVDGPIGSGTRVDHVKLFRNVPDVQFEGRIHEQILGSLRAKGGEIQRLDAVVLHAGYDTSVGGQAKKRKRDSTLLLLDLEDRPGHPFVLFNLAMTAHYNGEHESAIDWFRQCLDASVPEESHVRKVFALLSGSLRALGRPNDSLTVLSDGLRLYPGDPELLFLRGVAYMAEGQYGEARLDFEQIPEGLPGHFSSYDIGIQGFKKYVNLGMCCGKLSDFAGERHYLLRAMQTGMDPFDPASLLFDSAMARRDLKTCEEVVAHLESANQRGETWGRFLVELLEAKGLDPARALLAMQMQNPRDHRIGVVLAKYLSEHGRFAEAQPVLAELRRVGVADASFFMGVTAANVGDMASAAVFFDEALQIEPTHAGALRNLEILRAADTKKQEV